MWPRYHNTSRELKVSLLYLPQGSVSWINVASLLTLALQTATKNISIDFLTFHLTLYSHSLPISTTDNKRTHQLRCLKSPSRFQVLSLSDGLAPIGKRFMCFTTICQSNNSLLGGFRHNIRPWRAMTRESTGSRNILRKFGIISARWLISSLEKQKSCVEDVGKSLPIRRRRGMEQTP